MIHIENTTIAIGKRSIGAGQAAFIIAEAGVNHNGDLNLAKRLVDAAREAGADAVKFQTFSADAVASSSAPKASYQMERTANGTQLEMLRGLELPLASYQELKQYCCTRHIEFLSTPFDEWSVDFLQQIGVPALKIGSGDLTNTPLLRHAARTRVPIILSTGMATMEEIVSALEVFREAGGSEIALLHCVSCYPADLAECNLRSIQTMREVLQVPVGFSDHTTGFEAAAGAVAMGACLIEKHITLDRTMPGPDHESSLTPAGFKSFCSILRSVESALGDGIKRPMKREIEVAQVVRRSIHTRQPLLKGHALSAEDLTALRPGTGIPIARWDSVLGRRLSHSVKASAMLLEEDLE
jgi:N,N'-diacetyllegionaminate synthase